MNPVGQTFLLLQRHLKKTFSNPLWLFLGMLQPALYLLLYMPLLRNLGNTAALPLAQIAQIFVPGMIVIMGISSLFSGFGFIPEIRDGFITRLLVTPTSRVAILVSYILERVIALLLQVMILLVVAFLLGLRTSLMGIILTVLLVSLVGMSMAAISYIISISTKSEDTLASMVNTLYLPIMLLSGIMLPISLAPQWLKNAAAFNPFYYAVEAARSMFLGNFTSSNVIIGFVLMAALSVVSVVFAAKSLQKMAA